MRVSVSLFATAAFLGLIGPAAALAQPNHSQCDVKEANANSGTLLHLQLRDIPPSPSKGESETEASQVEVTGAVAVPSNNGPAGYTRLIIEYTPCSASNRNYQQEQRGWVKRLFSQKVVSKLLKITATVRPLGVNATRTLSSITRDSGKTGENWITSVENDSVLLPYFRSDQNTYVDFNIEFSSTRDYQTAVAGETLSVVKQAATLIAPASTLVTAVNKTRFNEAANFVDSTVDGLLKVAITESGHVGVQLNGGRQTLAIITLYVPGANDPYPRLEWEGNRYVGQWTISAERLTNSIFAPSADPNALQHNDLSAASIMNFGVADDKTLKEALTGASSVQTSRDALLENDDSVADAAIALCRAVARETDALGFSPNDVGNAVWAYIQDLGLGTAKAGSALTACKNVDHFPNLPNLAGDADAENGDHPDELPGG